MASVIAMLLVVGGAHEALADRVASLSRILLTSKHHKERIGAAVSLGRLEDRRALGALVKALGDEHQSVRALAAVALGRLGDERALPALRKAADDREPLVRQRVAEAIQAIQGHSGYKVSQGQGDAGFGNQPRLVQPPTLYVTLRSATDKSSDPASDRVRKARAARMKRLLARELEISPEVTMRARLARKLGLTRYNLDASITRLSQTARGDDMEVECEIRVAISDERGKMLSFMTGGAKVQVAKRSFRKKHLARLEREALESAVRGVQPDLVAELQRSHSSQAPEAP